MYYCSISEAFGVESLEKPQADAPKKTTKVERIKFIMQSFTLLFVNTQVKNISLEIQAQVMLEKCFPWLLKNLDLNAKYLWAPKIWRDKNQIVMRYVQMVQKLYQWILVAKH